MASKLTVTEFSTKGSAQNYAVVPIEVAQMPALTKQNLNFISGGPAVASSAFGASTRLIRVHAKAACSIVVGANPTATTDDTPMAANSTEYFGVSPGDKLSVIASD